MTPNEYGERSRNIWKRAEIVRTQIDGHIKAGQDASFKPLRDLIQRHQEIIDELSALDREFMGA